MQAIFTLLVGIALALHVGGQGGFGPKVKQSQGKIWPKPQFQKDFQTVYSLDPESFQIKTESKCDLVNEAVKRISSRLFPFETEGERLPPNNRGHLKELEVKFGPCEENLYPELDMDEHYEININTPDNPGVAQIVSSSPWGIIRGLESFTHLIYYENGKYCVNSTEVKDSPRFSHRGFMLDTSRHYQTVERILENLDLMEMNKLNVFHWHITDEESFPYQSKAYPQLEEKGSYGKYAIYTKENISRIVSEARYRGIRVMPEFDSPGHSASWEKGMPEIMTTCPSITNDRPALNPIKDNVYTFLKGLFSEIKSWFPDNFVHLGGDECRVICWENNKEIVEFMKKKGWTDYHKLEELYMNKLSDILFNLDDKVSPVVWQELFDQGAKLNNRTIYHVWKPWEKKVRNITEQGYRVILSSPFYLNRIRYGTDWPKYYEVNPTDFGGDEHQKKLVIGAEACLWGEFINSANIINIAWPRASAMAERLWSNENVTNVDDATPRIEEHACRMIARGHNVAPPNGPGYCGI